MSATLFDHHHPLTQEFSEAIYTSLESFLETQRQSLEVAGVGASMEPLFNQVLHYAQGGKRIRSAFCVWAYLGFSGQDPDSAVMDVAASLDLLHISALVHDDVIDRSQTRRGGPTAHRWFAEEHTRNAWSSDADHYGMSASILLGDLLAMWSVALMEQAAIPSASAHKIRPLGEAVRSEVLVGQYLDLLAESRPLDADRVLADARLVLDYKTAKYTVARPTQIGGALGGASDEALDQLGVFGAHIGRAFQLRDDVLGVFGDPELTGKPSGDDLRCGKKTILVGYALRDMSAPARQEFFTLLGKAHLSEAEVNRARGLLLDCGALERTEQEIAQEVQAGMVILPTLGLSDRGLEGLSQLVTACVERQS